MIAEQAGQQTNYAGTKYYQFYSVATILEHVIECLHTIVSDETNPYHPPLSWLTRKKLKSPQEQIFSDLFAECSEVKQVDDMFGGSNTNKPLSLKLRTELERLLKDTRRKIVTRTKDGCCPLFKACQFGHHIIVRYLLDNCDADIEQRGCYETIEDHRVHSVSPLWIAAVSGQLETVKVLLEKGAKVNSVSDTGSTPLRSVCFLCKEDDQDIHQTSENSNQDETDSSDIYFHIVKLLIENGADLKKSNYSGNSCLMNSIHNYQLTKYILKKGADVNATDIHSKTALHYAIQQGSLPVTKLLLSYDADPMLLTKNQDDALRLSCLCGRTDIFHYLIEFSEYPRHRLIDAFKLIGSSMLEFNFDLTKVRELWQTSVDLMNENANDDQHIIASNLPMDELCDKRRSLAFGDKREFRTKMELDAMSADEFRVQSLLISERILGTNHRELIQRLLYRGNFYLGSLRPDKCINVWIYALILRLKHESIFHSESIFTAQALTKLFLDLTNQDQQSHTQLSSMRQDIHDVATVLIDQLGSCQTHLGMKPSLCMHEDIFDALSMVIVKLMMILNYQKILEKQNSEDAKHLNLVRQLVKIDPRISKGNSLLHLCVSPVVIEIGAIQRQLLKRSLGPKTKSFLSPLGQFMTSLIDNGLDVDASNNVKLSALQLLCLQTSVRVESKHELISLLIDRNAHLDRRAMTIEQSVVIRETLRDAGYDPNRSMRLACLAAKSLSEARIKVDDQVLCKSLVNLLVTH